MSNVIQMRAHAGDQPRELVTFTIGEQLFGIAVLQVHDVLGPQPITRIHRAPPDVAGALNLRGRIVTAIDTRHRLGLGRTETPQKNMSIVVEHAGELYSLVVDTIGEVLALSSDTLERVPSTLDPRWREVSSGVHRLEGRLLVTLDVDRLLGFTAEKRAS